eukprot:scaffold90724_cov35-Tisochrysis_lutea.AAC.2
MSTSPRLLPRARSQRHCCEPQRTPLPLNSLTQAEIVPKALELECQDPRQATQSNASLGVYFARTPVTKVLVRTVQLLWLQQLLECPAHFRVCSGHWFVRSRVLDGTGLVERPDGRRGPSGRLRLRRNGQLEVLKSVVGMRNLPALPTAYVETLLAVEEVRQKFGLRRVAQLRLHLVSEHLPKLVHVLLSSGGSSH